MSLKPKTPAKKTHEAGERALTPKLRFPEFRDAPGWRSNHLIDVCSKVTQGGTPDTSKPEYWGGSINWMTPAEMGKSESPFIDATNRTITELGLRDCSSDLLPVHSVILSVRAPIGHLAINTAPMAINQGCKGLIAGKSLDHYFLFYSLVVSKTRLIDLGAGNTFKELSGAALKSFEIPIPSRPEQQKIADCLTSLDEVIAAQSQKLDALKTHKKGLMQQLFPREGETLPRLRFPEFQDAPEWEYAPLGKLLMSTPDYGVNAAAVPFSERLPKYLRITDISEDGLYLSDKQVSVDLEPTAGNYLDEGDIVLARTGASVGKSYRYQKEDGKLVFAGFLIRVKPNRKRLVSAYLANFLTTVQFWKWVAITSARSGQPGINSTEYSSLAIPLPPDMPEQQRIASCLTSIDNLIAAQSQKLEALKTHKKGLMQQLFPSPDEVEV